MKPPRCVVIGAGRMAGGFVAPVLRDAGWELILAGRDEAIVQAIDERRGVWLNIAGEGTDRWLDGVTAVSLDDANLTRHIAEADLLATAVGPASLSAVGQMLAPLLRARLQSTDAPINIVTFENHRRAPERLASGLLGADPSLAREIGRKIGIAGAVVWRIISQREVSDSGVRFTANAESEYRVDAMSLVPGAAPLDGSIPGIGLVQSFDDHMIEKLWVFNAGHCAAAYLGWAAGLETVDAAMAHPTIREAVAAVVGEAQAAVAAHLSRRPGSPPLPPRPLDAILACYVDPVLRDPIVRVAREPRRKLAFDDRLIGPAVALQSIGASPHALAVAAAAALAYGEPSDPQANNLQQELQLVGPEEVLATVSGLHPQDELARLIGDSYRSRVRQELAS